MESDHPEPVVRYWVSGFFISVCTLLVPLLIILDGAESPAYRGRVQSRTIKAPVVRAEP